MAMSYFDTHAHYTDARFDDDRDEVLRALPEAGVPLVLVPGCDAETSRQALALAERYPFVWAAAGIHPHEAAHETPGDSDALRALLRNERVVAVGEVGLDYHYDFSPRGVQLDCFRRQMALAREFSLPVIIHDREAHADTLAVVREYPDVRGVFHCYSGSLESAKILVALGYCISFTGVITFKNARKLLDVAAWLPDDRILLETDAPYMAPEPHRGRRNDSRYLPLVCEALARARGVEPKALARLTLENGKKLFGMGEEL